MSKLTLTLCVKSERTKYNQFGRADGTETETLCDVTDQHLSKGMLAAALRQLADEIDPQHKCEVAF
jgi:hypothetical protein